jgi:hypothetical protein
MIQLDFFDNDDRHLLKEEIRKLRESSHKVRKSLFAKHSELTKSYFELLHRLETIERSICLGTEKSHERNK